MDKLKQLKAILKIIGISGHDFANRLGLNYASYRTMTAAGAKTIPKWVNAFVMGWIMAHEEGLTCIECEVRENGHGIGYMFCEECIKEKSN